MDKTRGQDPVTGERDMWATGGSGLPVGAAHSGLGSVAHREKVGAKVPALGAN